MARLFNDEWWTHQLKGQRMRWHEALLIAVGEVNKDRSPYCLTMSGGLISLKASVCAGMKRY
ncbi:replication endonuclease [Escherichia coli]|uniref:replication endonuclease n=1 Tax=Escherichia coli TaxID=562 RepID=UPI0032DBB854